jgi:hypothetical protein
MTHPQQQEAAWQLMDRIYKRVVEATPGQPWPTTAFYDFGVPILAAALSAGAVPQPTAGDLLIAAAPVPCAASPADPWQPIETAPKDGTQVWAWDDERGSNPALFACEAEAWLITYDDEVIHPTHWMPLPSPPRATGEGARDEQTQTVQSETPSCGKVDARAQSSHRLVGDASCAVAEPSGHNAADPTVAPVAVSLDPHRLQSMADAVCKYVEWHGGIHDDGCPQDDTCDCSAKPINDGVNAACRYLAELARLRGEATVRPEKNEKYASRAEYENHMPWCSARQFNSLNVAKCNCDLKSATVRVEE